MKSRALLTILICIMCCAAVSGCGNSTENNDLAEKLNDVKEASQENDEPGSEKKDSEKKQEDKEKIYKGRAVLFDITVPEGMPAAVITVKTPGYDEATWDVMQLSCKIPQMSTFVK